MLITLQKKGFFLRGGRVGMLQVWRRSFSSSHRLNPVSMSLLSKNCTDSNKFWEYYKHSCLATSVGEELSLAVHSCGVYRKRKTNDATDTTVCTTSKLLTNKCWEGCTAVCGTAMWRLEKTETEDAIKVLYYYNSPTTQSCNTTGTTICYI